MLSIEFFRGMVEMFPLLSIRGTSFVLFITLLRVRREVVLIISFRARLNSLNKSNMRAKNHLIYIALLRANKIVLSRKSL
jgi:hypothetical protein